MTFMKKSRLGRHGQRSLQFREPRSADVMAKFAKGLIAGAAATVPQTIAMEAARRWMPVHPGRFPPRQVTEEALEALHVRRRYGFSESTWQVLTAMCHFAYGASAGAIYPFLPRRMHSFNGGALFGLLIWAGSYGVLLPLVRIRRPQMDHPIRKNLQLIIAHLIYGSSLALISRLLSTSCRAFAPEISVASIRRRASTQSLSDRSI